jgi:hypothetical protein
MSWKNKHHFRFLSRFHYRGVMFTVCKMHIYIYTYTCIYIYVLYMRLSEMHPLLAKVRV